jgi:S-formylglutathione hydrolase FrmB
MYRGLVAVLAWAVCVLPAQASGWRKGYNNDLEITNRQLQGRVVDYTNYHGKDNRIWSRALQQRRDMYVYLPPGYDPHKQYPLILWLHGFGQDETSLLYLVAPVIDAAIVKGMLPPMIIAAPDGSLNGEASLFNGGSFFINSQAGRFADYVLIDVWRLLHHEYSIRPEREAHILVGVSMGGFAAFNYGFKYRERFGVVLGIFPPLNLRWMDSRGRYMANFDPNNWGWRTDLERSREVVGKFAFGLVKYRLFQMIDPLFTTPAEALENISRENPIELMVRENIQPGDLEMFIAYGGKDQFNVDAQVESFLYVARKRGLSIGVAYDPNGRHDFATALRMFPQIAAWLRPRVEPYAPK